MSRLGLLWFAWLLALACASIPAQEGQRYPPPEKAERATKADAGGVLQWDAWPETKCIGCNGTGKLKCWTCARFMDDATHCIDCKRTKEREVVCRVCAGTGKPPDPLEKAICPGCRGASFLTCVVCSGGGRLRIDKAKQWSACPACRGDGGFKCTACNATRVVEPVAVKPSLKDASAANLGKALTATEASLREVSAFSPAGGPKARKEMKALVKILETAGAQHPPLKRAAKLLEDYMGKTEAGSQFQGHEEHQVEALTSLKDGAEYYLKHQKRMLELAAKRAEANAKLAEEQKGK